MVMGLSIAGTLCRLGQMPWQQWLKHRGNDDINEADEEDHLKEELGKHLRLR